MDHFLLAYIDPGSGALMLQALVAGAVGVLVFCRQLITNITSKLFGRRQADESSAPQLDQPHP
ncbi:MAG: hypothetical protein EHM55_01730 [Acidobacteria bacterium]|nr:MAG: hypothetical protein EHM55_01730 [Acidobacteriota bacterium]